MLSEEYRKKIKKAIEALTSIINQLENTPVDPRAITLLDIAASYLEEQKENNIEYHEESSIEFDAEDVDGDIIELIYGDEEDENSSENKNNREFKFLSPNAPEKATGDSIAKEIQEWYRTLDTKETD